MANTEPQPNTRPADAPPNAKPYYFTDVQATIIGFALAETVISYANDFALSPEGMRDLLETSRVLGDQVRGHGAAETIRVKVEALVGGGVIAVSVS